MNADPVLLLRLGAAFLLLQATLALLARGVGRRLRPEAIFAAWALPALLLLPWLTGPHLIIPTSVLGGHIPGTEKRPEEPIWKLNDLVFQLTPWEIENRRAFGRGRLPLWSDRIDGGSSPWANPQASVLAPTSMAARLLPVEHHALAALALKILVALEGAWVAARALGVRRPAALLAASGFALGGGILPWGLFPHSAPVAWAPWCIAGGLAVARRPTARRTASCALIVACLLLSGQPEIAVGASALTAAAAVTFGRRRRVWRGVAHVALAGVLGFALAAPALLPFAAIVPASQRAWDLEHGSREAGQAEAAELPWHETRQARWLRIPLSPEALGGPYRSIRSEASKPVPLSIYGGLLALAGAVLAAASRRSRRRAALWWGAYLFLFGLGANLPPLMSAWRHLPVLGLVVPDRLFPIAVLGLVLAAALGLDLVLRSRKTLPVAWVLLPIAGASLAISPSLVVGAIWLAILAAVAIAPRWRTVAFALLALAMLGDQVPWGRRQLPVDDPHLFYPMTPEMEQFVRLAGGPGGRAVGIGYGVYPSILAAYGLSDPRPHDPLASHRYLETLGAAFDFTPSSRHYFSAFLHPEHPFLEFLGVRAVLSYRGAGPISGMRLARSSPGLQLFVNHRMLPRCFLARRYDVVPRAAIPTWIRDLRDPRRVALSAEELAERPFPGPPRGGRVQRHGVEPGRFALGVPAPGVKLLATSIRGPEGWTALGGGRRLRTLTVDGAFLGVVVPAGVDRVSLSYLPPGLLPGLWLAVFGAAALVALGVGERRRRRLGRAVST